MNPASQYNPEAGSLDESIRIDQPSTHHSKRSSSEILNFQLPTCLIEGTSGTTSKGGSDIRVTIDEVLKEATSRLEVSSKGDLRQQDSADDPNREIQVKVVKGGSGGGKRSDAYRTTGSSSSESDSSKEYRIGNLQLKPIAETTVGAKASETTMGDLQHPPVTSASNTKMRNLRRPSLAETALGDVRHPSAVIRNLRRPSLAETTVGDVRHPSLASDLRRPSVASTGMGDVGRPSITSSTSDTRVGDLRRSSVAAASRVSRDGHQRPSIAASDVAKRNVLRLPPLREFSSEEDSAS